MKTEKQIKILSLKKGDEYNKKTEILDSIYINNADLKKHLANPKFKELPRFMLTPFLKSGVFIVDYNFFIGKMLFDVDFKEDFFEINATILSSYESKEVFFWDASIVCDVPYIIEKKLDYIIKNYRDASIEVFEKQHKKKEYIDMYIQKKAKEVSNSLDVFLQVLSYINFLMQNPGFKEVQNNKKAGNNSKSGKKTKQKQLSDASVKLKRTVFLNNIKIKTSNNNVKKIKSKKVEKIGCWNVRGHFRHYKSGKIIYIKPYKKGKAMEKNKKIQKKYVFKEENKK